METNVFSLSRLLVLFGHSRDYIWHTNHHCNYSTLEINLKVNTGGQYTGRGVSENDNRPVHSEHDILFDASSTYLQSPIIHVKTDAPVMLVAYEIPTDATFTIENVSIGSRAVLNGSGCCNPCQPSLDTNPAADILFRTPMTLGGKPWKMDASNRQLLISLPGTYILVLNDEQYLGEVHVELVTLGKIKSQIPDNYVAGIVSSAASV